MTKVLLLELVHHHECLLNSYMYFKEQGYDTKLILGEFVYKRLHNSGEISGEDIFIIKQPGRKSFSSSKGFDKIVYIIKQFFEISKNVKESISLIDTIKPDILYVNTVESPFLIPLIIYLLGKHTFKKYIVIHNTNRLKVGFLKYFYFDFLIKKLITAADQIVLLGKYLSFSNTEIQKKVIYFNNRFPVEKKYKKYDKTTFVISGSLNNTTKDISSVFKGFRKFIDVYPVAIHKIQLLLLGKTTTDIAKLIQLYSLESIVTSYSRYITEEEMEEGLSKSHYAIISVPKHTIYGKYKISGAFGDAIGFNLPILLSEHYAPGYNDDAIIRFKNDDFYKTLSNILQW